MSPITCKARMPTRIHSASRLRRFSAVASTARNAPYAMFGGAGNSTLSTNLRTGCTFPKSARPTAELTHSTATTSTAPAVILGILLRHRRRAASSCWTTVLLPGRGSAARPARRHPIYDRRGTARRRPDRTSVEFR